MAKNNRQTRLTGSSRGSSLSDALHSDMQLEEIQTLPLEALRLHCNTRNLVQSGPRKVLAERLYQWLQAECGTTSEAINRRDKEPTKRVKRHPGKSATQSTNRLKTRARGPNRAKPKLSASRRKRIASRKRSPTPQRYKKQRLTSLSSPSSSSDESHRSSDTASATSSSATSDRTSNHSRHYSSSSRDERKSSKHGKRRSARTSHAEKRAPKLRETKYGSHHNKRKRQHRSRKLSRTTSSSCSSSEDDTTFCKSSRHAYGGLPASHSLPAIPKKQLKQIRRGEYVDFNVLVARAGLGLPLTPTTKANPGLRVSSLPKWFHAWNQFLLANVVYHPDLVPALLIYQARICQYAEHQDFNSVVCYDAAVCTRIANNPNMHWDDQFPDEFNSFLGGKKHVTPAVPLCFVCNQPGHFAASCSLRSPYPNRFRAFPPNSQFPQEVSGAQSNAPQPSSGTIANFHPQMQRSRFCGQYNKYGKCSAGCHPATHKCNRPGCGGSHPGRTCPSFTKFD